MVGEVGPTSSIRACPYYTTNKMESFHRLKQWLLDNTELGDTTVLMPMIPNAKKPLFGHKENKWGWTELEHFYQDNRDYMHWGLLLDRFVAVDCDDVEAVEWMETLALDEPAIGLCAIQNTKHGRHYIFKRPSWADEEGYYDKARQTTGIGVPNNIDVKTICSTGTRGLLTVAPSTGKHWFRAPWDCPGGLPEIPRSLLELVAEKKMVAKNPVPKQLVAKTPGHVKFEMDENEPDVSLHLEITSLVRILHIDRANSQTSWMEVGWCLHNIGKQTFLPLWVEFSKRGNTFKEGECEGLWDKMRNDGLQKGSLHMWAKKDSPCEYKKIVNVRVFAKIEACNGSHNEVAAITYTILKEHHVCATANSKLWYVFDGTLWKEDREAINVRHELSTTVRDQFVYTINKLNSNNDTEDIDTISVSSRENHTRDALMRIAFKLQDSTFKDKVIKEMVEYFFDPEFLQKLDADPNLIAFTNGVWELKEKRFRQATPHDFLSISTGYAFHDTTNEEKALQVASYWETLHPDADQRSYVQQTFARQLYGDHGQELFHIHAGHMATASNGKSKFFDILERCLGGYVRKFGVEVLTTKLRLEPGKPMPEYAAWRGVRIMYCSEPNHDEMLNSGIMKDLTGGEAIVYRLLFSNDVHLFRPQFKLHIMCNDTPQIDGSDSGMKRRVRVISYLSRFVDAGSEDPASHCYTRDSDLIQSFKNDDLLKAEFLRVLLLNYSHEFQFGMPQFVVNNSRLYLEDNDAVHRFMTEFLTPDPSAYFSLKDAISIFKTVDYYNRKPKTLKTDLQKLLGAICHEQKKISGLNCTNIFMGFRLGSVQEGEDFVS